MTDSANRKHGAETGDDSLAPDPRTPPSSTPDPRTRPSPEALLSVRGLCKHFPIYSTGFRRRQVGLVKAADEISFDLMPGETLGLVGESGCGKTTAGRTILRAIAPTRGEVLFRATGASDEREGRVAPLAPAPRTPHAADGDAYIDLAQLSRGELRRLRPRMQMIFQDPFASLNPRMTVREIIGEPLVIHRLARGSELEDRVAEMLRMVGLKPGHSTRYPHAFSGGQRQRIGIARALVMRPSLVVCDEAVSALDVSVQAQVINLLQDLQEQLGLTYIFIAHDLSVVKHLCDRIAVMYAGRIVELAPTGALFDHPLHPYSRGLLSAVPNADPTVKMNMDLSGEVADPGDLPGGCSFHPRCSACFAPCAETYPALREVEPGRFAACHLHRR